MCPHASVAAVGTQVDVCNTKKRDAQDDGLPASLGWLSAGHSTEL